ncbi:6691_t:CDS:1, partial [Cetraspora pellucida]
KAALISVTSLNINYNHALDPMTNSYATKNQTLLKAIMQEIFFYITKRNLSATIQRRLLSAKFPNITIYPHDLQNLIQKYKVANWKENDASKLLRQLLTKKSEEQGWEVF